MKKLFLAAFAVFAFATVNAQEITWGAKAGVNFSNFTGDADTDAITAFYVGGLADISISEKFHVQPEVLFSMEGADGNNGADAGVSFLRVPVMAKYYVADGLNLQAGPSFGFKVSADDAIDNAVKSFDLGLGAGAAYELESGLFFDARYTFGLTDFSDVNGFEINTSNFQVGVGYRFK